MDGKDREIAERIKAGDSLRSIRKRFSIGWHRLNRIKNALARQGWSPEHDMRHPVPDGYLAKGVSTYYDKDGKPAGQWVKSAIDHQRQAEIFSAAAEAMAEELKPLEPVTPPVSANDELCNFYVLTDCHVGMLAWHKEGGDDWDLKIAERTLVDCFANMMRGAPDSGSAVIAQMGDFLHFDGLLPVTPTNAHVLDADGRFGKVVECAIRILRRVIDMALAKHQTVHVIMAEGNHDLSSSVWLRKMFSALYESEPRLTVNDSELPYYVHEHGQTLLAVHHGHMVKNARLPSLLAAQFAEQWGRTRKRYMHVGHRHHTDVKDHPGVTVVQHPTLAARDAHASRGGWISERQASCVTYHVTHGKVAETVVTPEMVA